MSRDHRHALVTRYESVGSDVMLVESFREATPAMFSSDATASGTGSQTGKTAYSTYFRSTTAGSEDLHLRNYSLSLWGSRGADVSADANLRTSRRTSSRGVRPRRSC